MNLPLEFLLNASAQTLSDTQLASMNRGAQHLKAAKVSWNAAIDEFVNAEIAAIFRDRREEILDKARKTIEEQSVIVFPERKRA